MGLESSNEIVDSQTDPSFPKTIFDVVYPISILLNLDQALARDRATSRAIPGRRIGRADGLDLVFPGHFVKKSSNLGYFVKKTSTFCKKNPRT